jgi:lysosomal Pro-X carboxypeptidase
MYLVWDIAPTFNAMVIFAEHRYYGQSLPYGNVSYSKPEYSK